LIANPIVNFSSVLGTNVLALGTEISFDTDWEFHQMQHEKGDSINVSYCHIVNPSTNTTIGTEMTHSFSTNVNTITIGTQHALDPLTIIKARVNNIGKASALIQHKWCPKSLFTIFGKVDTKSIDKSP
ncbi:hypothetical protein J1N35_022691, partial [Gossypium stocksii]